jgi:hypothetical protein
VAGRYQASESIHVTSRERSILPVRVDAAEAELPVLSVESGTAASNPTTAQALSAFERPFTRAPSAEDFERGSLGHAYVVRDARAYPVNWPGIDAGRHLPSRITSLISGKYFSPRLHRCTYPPMRRSIA